MLTASARPAKDEASEATVRVSVAWAKRMAWRQLGRLAIGYFAFAALVVTYKVVVRHSSYDDAIPLLLGLLPVVLFNKPWISVSSNTWVFVVNKDGISLKDTADFINPVGYEMLSSKKNRLISAEASSWKGNPAIRLRFLGKNGKTMRGLLVYRPEDQETVSRQVMPQFLAWQASEKSL